MYLIIYWIDDPFQFKRESESVFICVYPLLNNRSIVLRTKGLHTIDVMM